LQAIRVLNTKLQNPGLNMQIALEQTARKWSRRCNILFYKENCDFYSAGCCLDLAEWREVQRNDLLAEQQWLSSLC
jgi:hypothetical protein